MKSIVRTPRAIVTINDIQVKWIDIEIDTTTFFFADTYHISIPLNGQIATLNMSYWASSPQFTVKIYIGFPSDPDMYTTQDLDLFIEGDANNFDFNPITGIINISGRDLSSRLIDKKFTGKFSQNTSSQIATQFANNAGLTPQVTTTTTPVGTFFQTQQTLLSSQYTQWDILTYLAQQENFVLYVDSQNLVFKPRPTTSNTDSQNNYILTYQAPTIDTPTPSLNATRLTISRSATLINDVSVTVKVPYNCKTGQAFSVRVNSSHTQSSSRNTKASTYKQKYVYRIPGLTQDQALQRADQLLRDITTHEIRICTCLPGDNILKKDTLIKLVGTNCAFDQIYYPDHINRRLNMHEGYIMEVSAKNKSDSTEVTTG